MTADTIISNAKVYTVDPNEPMADMVLLDADIFAVEPDALKMIRPLMTMCDGEVIYQR